MKVTYKNFKKDKLNESRKSPYYKFMPSMQRIDNWNDFRDEWEDFRKSLSISLDRMAESIQSGIDMVGSYTGNVNNNDLEDNMDSFKSLKKVKKEMFELILLRDSIDDKLESLDRQVRYF